MRRRRPWARGPGGMAVAMGRGKGEGSVGIRFPYQLWAEVACGGGSTTALGAAL